MSHTGLAFSAMPMLCDGLYLQLCVAMIQSIRKGAADFREAFRQRNVWMELAMEDISDQHKRTYLGPIWLLLNYLAFAGTFVVIFGLHSAIPNFGSYVAVGLFVWLYLSEVILQSVSLFIREEAFIKGSTLPLTVYVMRLVTQSVIRAGYALVGCIGILLVAGSPLSPVWGWSLIAMALIVVTTPAAIVVFALFGVLFPDLQFILNNVMRIGMFLTPIFWIDAGDSGLRSAVHLWNPFTYFLEIVRAPIYSSTVPYDAYFVVLPICALLWVVALAALGFWRNKVAFIL